MKKCIEIRTNNLNRLIDRGISQDAVDEFIDSDVQWIRIVGGYEQTDVYACLNYYFERLRK